MAKDQGLAKVLECTLCSTGFSLVDVEAGRFFPSTGVCRSCYVVGQKTSRKVWCFGKRDLKRNGKVVLKAFNSEAIECTTHCPDREICQMFILSKDKRRIA